ncbi:MAG: hypothetical protein K2N65_03215 [Anaeroplasmataceae bacterium]|nr:hypothetical protein [Anaeroplasmataceae bacterium]
MNVLDMISNQQHIYEVLKQNKINDRLSHAYLFYGDEGVGKKEMAYALACLFYCEHEGCLECETCKNILEGQHLNVSYIGVLESKKLISKEQITDLQEEFSKTSLLDGPRIYIVDGIDTASASAQNSLLKFIEEPMNNTPTIGIFIAKDLANVVSTIISRCSLIHFPSIDVKKLSNLLISDGVDALDASLASLITNNVSLAKELLLTKEYQETKELFLNFLEIKNQKQAVLFYVQEVSRLTLENMNLFFKWLIAFYEDIFKIEDKEGLILTALYDKILMYAKTENSELKAQFAFVLNLYSKLNYNVSAKNIFHELISKLF